MFTKKIKSWIKRYLDYKRFKRKAYKSRSYVTKPLKIRNQKYIKLGSNVKLYENARIECYDSFNQKILSPSLIIGDNVIINNNFTALIADECTIGDNTIIAHNVSIINENHGVDINLGLPFSSQSLSTKPISIGKNCWIGCNAVFVPGSSVGDNCVVGAGAVVNKSFPPNSMIVGVPAKRIKEYDTEQGIWIPLKNERKESI